MRVLLLLFYVAVAIARRHRHLHKPHHKCQEPLTLKDELAEWMRESLEGATADVVEADWTPPSAEPPLCEQSPRAEGDTTVMQRALCPWETKVNYDENREPKILSESFCLCRRSRGATGAFCQPITREVPVLKRSHCSPTTGTWHYSRSTQTITVGCHSVLPRSQRATPLSKHYKLSENVAL